MAYTPPNVNGQATMANSAPVTIASDQSTLPVNGASLEAASLTAASLNADLVPSTDVSVYKWLSLQIKTLATGGTITFQGSNDNTTWASIPLSRLSNSTSAPSATGNAVDMYAGAIQFRYFRARQTGYTSGSTTGTLELYTLPPAAMYIGGQVAINGTASVNNSQINGVTPLMGAGATGTGSQRVTVASTSTGTITSVTAATSSTTVLAANTSRRGATFYNESTAILYLAFASTASTTAYTVQIPANGYYELPPVQVYAGIVTGIWSAANGSVRVTEIV